MNDEQYKLLSVRRTAINNIIWQIPPLATAGQAFLLAASFNPLMNKLVATSLAAFSVILGLASIQAMAKHRYLEMRDSEKLLQFEKANAEKGYAILHGPLLPINGIRANWFVRMSSFRVWTVVLCGFCSLGLMAVYHAFNR